MGETLMSKLIYPIMQKKKKIDLKNASGVHTSNFAAKSTISKAGIDKLDVEKSKATPVELRKVGNVVNNDVSTKLSLTN